ncbi:MAG: ATP-dependent endonuclease [Spirochaetae bacterium HGW-Spirochaetae-3]|jgi:AAA15 family ATPase/GTPase|nr:MAG: ATP-dependent endonuclease [Spirochaetae bacterium HGW-Spirochaetae-3]
MRKIKKLKLHNYRRFQNLSLPFTEDRNILIGDNESGKSTILSAIDLVLSGNRARIDNSILEHIFNKDCIVSFLASQKDISTLPVLFIELYLNDFEDHRVNGRNNSEHIECNGLLFECIPDQELTEEISEILSQPEPIFPFEFYTCSFFTFSGEPYNGYKRYLNFLNVDNSRIGSDYSHHEYVSGMYDRFSDEVEHYRHRNEYRKIKETFNASSLVEVNSHTGSFNFGVKNDAKSNFINDLTIFEDGIPIEQKGKGRQCFVKTEFALSQTKRPLDVILLEEPENHLSHSNMRKLINNIEESAGAQLFIATHSNLICSRMDLRNSIMLGINSNIPLFLNDLSEDTAKYFMKAPDHSMLEFILSKKVILVEGDAEYILMESFFETVSGKTLDEAKVNVISVDGTSFNRYLEIANIVKIKCAVVRDNDGNIERNCVTPYTDFITEYIHIFFDNDPERSTFERCIYRDNIRYCDILWKEERRTLSVEDYMLSKKAQTSFELLESGLEGFKVPEYIKSAIVWINE